MRRLEFWWACELLTGEKARHATARKKIIQESSFFQIDELFVHLPSQYWASYFESSGRVSSLGSRSLHLHLNAGDTVTLGTGDQGHYGEFSGLWYITLCMELKQQDTMW